MLHNIPEVCQLTNKTRTEIYVLLNNGDMSYVIDQDGKRKVETSELVRVFPSLGKTLLINNEPERQQKYSKDIYELRGMITDLKQQVETVLEDNRRLLRLLEYQNSQLQKTNSVPPPATDMAKQGWQQYQQTRKQTRADLTEKETKAKAENSSQQGFFKAIKTKFSRG